jgi:electron transport complex protein RnfB
MRKIIITTIALLLVIAAAQAIIKCKVNAQKCIGCRACIPNCPAGAISYVGGKAAIDPAKCIGCGNCSKVCPVGAPQKLQPPDYVEPPIDTAHIVIVDDTAHAKPDTVKVARPKQSQTKSDSARAKKKPVAVGDKPPDTTKATPTNIQKPDSALIQTKHIATVNTSKCIGCGMCVNSCPTSAIQIINGKAVIDPSKCTGVGHCVNRCPMQAIKLQ